MQSRPDSLIFRIKKHKPKSPLVNNKGGMVCGKFFAYKVYYKALIFLERRETVREALCFSTTPF